MVHLRPLLGSPRFQGSMEEIMAGAYEDARILNDGGVDGLIIENFGDKPFHPNKVLPHTVSIMTIIAHEIKNRYRRLRIGINVLRNDAEASRALPVLWI